MSSFFATVISAWPGIAGLVCVVVGITYHCTKNRCSLPEEARRRNILFFAGGLFLLGYSLLRNDPVFVVLQLVVLGAAAWEYLRTFRPQR